MKEKKFNVFNILWDVDDAGENDLDAQEVLDSLPTETNVRVTSDNADLDDNVSIADYISDYLSDEYGFCHNGFEFNEI